VGVEELFERLVVQRVATILAVDREQRHRAPIFEVDHRSEGRGGGPGSITAAS
jgi:hypothetical protein